MHLLFTESSMCGPGWYHVGSSCYRFIIKGKLYWHTARFECLKKDSILATFDYKTLNDLSAIVHMSTTSNLKLYTGFQTTSVWRWQSGNKEMLSDFWGPGEPSGNNEYCGSFSYKRWNGWRWNDEDCLKKAGYICEETKSKKKNNVQFGNFEIYVYALFIRKSFH